MKKKKKKLYHSFVPRLKDEILENIPAGTLIFPSRDAQLSPRGGNYYLEDLLGFAPDCDIFPAVILPDSNQTYVKILTPSGVHMISKFSLVSHERSR